jgi:hypothetical protein
MVDPSFSYTTLSTKEVGAGERERNYGIGEYHAVPSHGFIQGTA